LTGSCPGKDRGAQLRRIRATNRASITAAGSTAAYTDRIVADTTSAAFSLRLPAAASGQLPFVITNIGPNLLTHTGTVSGEVKPTVPQWSSRTIASNGTILYFT
jgi:hypothetical protein